jgi:LmbE family N-acetylglucosaminyl deacetylase
MRIAAGIIFGLMCWFGSARCADKPVVLVIAADTENYLLAAGGTIAGMIDHGAVVHVIRVANDDKSSWGLSPEETALRARTESEQAGKALGVTDVISMGYREAELAEVPFTTLRDRLMVYIRHYRPMAMFIPNPYSEYDRVLDRYYTGRAAEDAWRSAAFDNYLPPFGALGLKPHLTPELYYYAQPIDPRRRDAESTSTFVPQVKIIDIAATLKRKLAAVQALKTANRATAMRLKARLNASNRKLSLLEVVNEDSVNRLIEENVRGLAKISAASSTYQLAEEFRYAGPDYRIPAKYRR